MAEYIMEINEAFGNVEKGEYCFRPIVVGKLIRCKDCKYYYELKFLDAIHTFCDLNQGYSTFTEPNDYCSYGQEKET